MKQLVHQFDSQITSLIRRLPQDWHPVFAVMTQIGHPITVLILAGLVMFGARAAGNTRLLLAAGMVPATLLVGSILKLLFSRLRPPGHQEIAVLVDTYSFPSGHATGSMVAYGLLALVAWHLLPQPWALVAAMACAAIILFVGISRVYLGVHFPSDVLAGWLLGAIAVGLIIFVIKPFGIG